MTACWLGFVIGVLVLYVLPVVSLLMWMWIKRRGGPYAR
jgi:hypothetical protein